MITKQVTLYTASELEGEAREKAISENRAWNTDDIDWAECITDNFKEENKLFEVSEVYFSGFCSQGDGACFEYTSITQELLNLACDSLSGFPKSRREALKRIIPTYIFTGKHRGNYYHENSIEHEVRYHDIFTGDYQRLEGLAYDKLPEVSFFIEEKARELSQDLYSTLEKEYDYLTGEESIIEELEENGVLFYSDGRRY